MNNQYDEEYFERGIITGKSGYSNFRWIPELTIPMCARLSEKLQIKDTDNILDFGCAKGYVVKAFRLIGKRAWGVDISEYAIKKSDDATHQYLYNGIYELQDGKKYDWVIAKDVFEHIPYEMIDNVLTNLNNNCKKLFCCLPLGENNKYFIASYDLDITHIIRENLDWWKQKFESNGFIVKYADYSFDIMKSNYSDFKNGNGFFILETKE